MNDGEYYLQSVIHTDARFLRGVELFNQHEFFDASEEFEELFFEAIRDEVEFVRVFLQVSVGLFHTQMKQWRPGVERLQEGVLAIDRVVDDRGYDLAALRGDAERAIAAARQKERGYFAIRRRG